MNSFAKTLFVSSIVLIIGLLIFQSLPKEKSQSYEYDSYKNTYRESTFKKDAPSLQPQEVPVGREFIVKDLLYPTEKIKIYIHSYTKQNTLYKFKVSIKNIGKYNISVSVDHFRLVDTEEREFNLMPSNLLSWVNVQPLQKFTDTFFVDVPQEVSIKELRIHTKAGAVKGYEADPYDTVLIQ